MTSATKINIFAILAQVPHNAVDLSLIWLQDTKFETLGFFSKEYHKIKMVICPCYEL